MKPDGFYRPQWSPDGKWIAFTSDRNTEWKGHDNGAGWEHLQELAVYIVHPDGTGLKRISSPAAPQSDHELEWNYLQTYKPFAVDLVLTADRLRYIQELNVSFKVQKSLLPFERVADMSLAAEAVKLLR